MVVNMSDELTLGLNFDTADDETKLEALSRYADALMTKMSKVVQYVRTNAAKIARSINAMVDIFSGVLKAAGIQIGAVGEAIIASIGITLQSVISMRSIMDAGTGGWSLGISIALVSLAVISSVIAIANAQAGISNVQTQLNGATATMRGLQSLSTIW